MLSDEEWKAINNLNFIIVTDIYDNEVRIDKTKIINEYNESVGIVLNLIRKQSKEIEELKKQLDLDNECEIALNNRIMDLEKEIEELKEKNKPQSDCEEPIERTEEMVNMKWVNHNYISKDKIKAKIEEIDREIKFEQNEKVIIWLYKQKKVLQSLLEKE